MKFDVQKNEVLIEPYNLLLNPFKEWKWLEQWSSKNRISPNAWEP